MASFLAFSAIANNIEKLCERKKIIIETNIDKILDINVDKKNTSESNISNFKKVNINDQTIK
jgi:hypothetical protein